MGSVYEEAYQNLRALYADGRVVESVAAAKRMCGDPKTPRYYVIQSALVIVYGTDDLDEAWRWCNIIELQIIGWQSLYRDTSRQKGFADLFEGLWQQLADAQASIREAPDQEARAEQQGRDAIESSNKKGKAKADQEEGERDKTTHEEDIDSPAGRPMPTGITISYVDNVVTTVPLSERTTTSPAGSIAAADQPERTTTSPAGSIAAADQPVLSSEPIVLPIHGTGTSIDAMRSRLRMSGIYREAGWTEDSNVNLQLAADPESSWANDPPEAEEHQHQHAASQPGPSSGV